MQFFEGYVCGVVFTFILFVALNGVTFTISKDGVKAERGD